MAYQVSDNGVLFLEKWEGFRPKPYQNPGDVPTIGIGTTFYPGGKHVTLADPAITHDQALAYAKSFMNNVTIPTITKYVKVPLNQNQVDSLGSFIYNVGAGNFAASHLLFQINSNGGQAAITAEFNKWIYVNHHPNDWQIKRRAAEVVLYYS